MLEIVGPEPQSAVTELMESYRSWQCVAVKISKPGFSGYFENLELIGDAAE
jgi:hypothetical protein